MQGIFYVISIIGLGLFVFTDSFEGFGLLIYFVFLILYIQLQNNFIQNKIRMDLLIMQRDNKVFINSIYGKVFKKQMPKSLGFETLKKK